MGSAGVSATGIFSVQMRILATTDGDRVRLRRVWTRVDGHRFRGILAGDERPCPRGLVGVSTGVRGTATAERGRSGGDPSAERRRSRVRVGTKNLGSHAN